MLTYSLKEETGTSLYDKLYRCIRDDIASGRIRAGEKLPSKRAFAEHLGVSVITIEGAYDQLKAEGYIQSQPKRGYFACTLGTTHPQPDRHLPLETRSVAAPEYDLCGTSWRTETIPLRSWERHLHAAIQDAPACLTAAADAAGSLRLRRAIAGHLRRFRGLDADPACIVVGAGAQNLYGLATQLLDVPETVAVEDPGYPAMRHCFAVHGCMPMPLNCDEAGMRIDALEASKSRIAHVMPSHQFPTGRVMPVSRRYALLSWANEKDSRWVIEDDYDCEFRMTGRPIPALKSIDSMGKVIYLNTFSRTLAPTIRMAYAVLPTALAERFRSQDWRCSNVPGIDQTALALYMEDGGFERHINRMKTRYRSVRDAMLEEIGRGAHDGRLKAKGCDSGLHFLLEVVDADESVLVQRAKQARVKVRGLASFRELPEPASPATLVISYAGLTEENARNAMKALLASMEQS